MCRLPLTVDPELVYSTYLGGIGEDNGQGIAVDKSGNTYVTGNFAGTAAFGGTSLTSAGDRDIFVSKISSAGAVLWGQDMGGPAEDVGFDLAVDRAGNIYTTGYFTGTADFDPGPATFNLTATGNHSAFVSQLTPGW